MLVLAAASSMKTSACEFSAAWPIRHWVRACATSARSCSAAWRVFFICQLHRGKHVGDRLRRARQLQPGLQLAQRQVGLRRHRGPQGPAMLLQQTRLVAGESMPMANVPGAPALLQEFFHHAFPDTPKRSATCWRVASALS
jgi:hypothetical protein